MSRELQCLSPMLDFVRIGEKYGSIEGAAMDVKIAFGGWNMPRKVCHAAVMSQLRRWALVMLIACCQGLRWMRFRDLALAGLHCQSCGPEESSLNQGLASGDGRGCKRRYCGLFNAKQGNGHSSLALVYTGKTRRSRVFVGFSNRISQFVAIRHGNVVSALAAVIALQKSRNALNEFFNFLFLLN